MNWLTDMNIYLQGFLVGLIVFLMVLITTIYLIIRKKPLSNKNLIMIKSSSAGFFLITAIIGQFVTARTELINKFETVNSSNLPLGSTESIAPSASQSIAMVSVFAISIVLAFVVIYSFKRISERKHMHLEFKKNELHRHAEIKGVSGANFEAHLHTHTSEEHNKKDDSSNALSIALVLAHRFPAGISMGGILYLANQSSSMVAWPVLIVFILHIIPEAIFLYTTYYQISKSRIRSIIFTLLIKMIFIPLIIFGIYINTLSSNVFDYIRPGIFVFTGALLFWASIGEIIPQVIRSKISKNMTLDILIPFISGALLSMMIQLIHIH